MSHNKQLIQLVTDFKSHLASQKSRDALEKLGPNDVTEHAVYLNTGHLSENQQTAIANAASAMQTALNPKPGSTEAMLLLKAYVDIGEILKTLPNTDDDTFYATLSQRLTDTIQSYGSDKDSEATTAKKKAKLSPPTSPQAKASGHTDNDKPPSADSSNPLLSRLTATIFAHRQSIGGAASLLAAVATISWLVSALSKGEQAPPSPTTMRP